MKMALSNRRRKWFRLWLSILAVLVSVPLAVTIHSWHESSIALRERTTEGTITQCRRIKNGFACTFAYSVAGRKYTAEGDPPGGHISVGEPVTVHFDPQHPATSNLIDFATRGRDDREIAVFLIAFVALICGALFFRFKSYYGGVA